MDDRCRIEERKSELATATAARDLSHFGPRAHRIAFRKVAVLDHRDTSKRERRRFVALRAESIARRERTRRGRDQ